MPFICLFFFMKRETRSTEISKFCLISASCLKCYFVRGHFILTVPCSVSYFSLLNNLRTIASPRLHFHRLCVVTPAQLDLIWDTWFSHGADCRHQFLHPVPPSPGRTIGHLATGKAVAVWNHQRTDSKPIQEDPVEGMSASCCCIVGVSLLCKIQVGWC